MDLEVRALYSTLNFSLCKYLNFKLRKGTSFSKSYDNGLHDFNLLTLPTTTLITITICLTQSKSPVYPSKWFHSMWLNFIRRLCTLLRVRFYMSNLIHFLKNKWVGMLKKGGAMCPSPLPKDRTPHGWISCIVCCARTGAKGRAVLIVKRMTCVG